MSESGKLFFTVLVVLSAVFFTSNVYAESCKEGSVCEGTTKSCYYGECLYPKDACKKALEFNSQKALKAYLKIYKIGKKPKGKCSKEAKNKYRRLQDSAACKKARKEKTLEGWQKYQKKYPRGQCASEAKEFISNICLLDQVNIDGHCCEKGQDWSVRSNRCIDAVPVPVPVKGWALIESGSFQMGSPDHEDGHQSDEGPVHKVTISRPFLLKKTEVTQGEWRSLMGNSPSYFSDCGDDCPVERVSWWDSLAYCNALSKSDGLEECYKLSDCKGTVGGGCDGNDGYCFDGYQCSSVNFKGLDCKGYRLPTEAEWEYAARAGSSGKYYADNLDDIAWYGDNSDGKTHPVGQKSPNKWELYDVSGNVWEWTWNWYDSDYYSSSPKVDPFGAKTGHYRVYRGGSWSDFARNCRLANRCYGAPGFRYLVVGLRPARSLDP